MIELPTLSENNKALGTFRFESITEPDLVALFVGNASGSKLLQTFLDNHPQIYMIPGYPLVYFYPHWETWKEELRDDWNWKSIIDTFCIKHASILDTRRIPGLAGLTTLGKNQDEFLAIDENFFRHAIARLLENQEISSKTFFLAVHYAYALCNGEDLSKKKILLYHIHKTQYILKYLLIDFPSLKAIGMVRDPRLNIFGRFKSSICNVDDVKLNKTDALIYRNRTYLSTCDVVFDDLKYLTALRNINIKMIAHEDMGVRLENVMMKTASFLGIDFLPVMLEMTFGGKKWWGDKIYEKKATNRFNPKILDKKWQKKISWIDCFVLEGVLYDYFHKYEYRDLQIYKRDTGLNRLLLFLAILIPSKLEISILRQYLSPSIHITFLKACRSECSGEIELKDYTKNASYYYRWCYIDIELWRSRWHVSLLKTATKQIKKNPNYLRSKIYLNLAYAVYIMHNYARFWWSIITFPAMIVKRACMLYGCLIRRIRKENVLPDHILSFSNNGSGANQKQGA